MRTEQQPPCEETRAHPRARRSPSVQPLPPEQRRPQDLSRQPGWRLIFPIFPIFVSECVAGDASRVYRRSTGGIRILEGGLARLRHILRGTMQRSCGREAFHSIGARVTVAKMGIPSRAPLSARSFWENTSARRGCATELILVLPHQTGRITRGLDGAGSRCKRRRHGNTSTAVEGVNGIDSSLRRDRSLRTPMLPRAGSFGCNPTRRWGMAMRASRSLTAVPNAHSLLESVMIGCKLPCPSAMLLQADGRETSDQHLHSQSDRPSQKDECLGHRYGFMRCPSIAHLSGPPKPDRRCFHHDADPPVLTRPGR